MSEINFEFVDGKYILKWIYVPGPEMLNHANAVLTHEVKLRWYKCPLCGVEAWDSDGDGVPSCPACGQDGPSFMEPKDLTDEEHAQKVKWEEVYKNV